MPAADLELYLRDAEADDIHWLWVLANDPESRSVSFSDCHIEWEDHVEWFVNALENPNRRIIVAQDADREFVGQIRFDLEQAEAVVSIQIVPTRRGQGLGRRLIVAGTQRYLAENPSVSVVHAFIKVSNAVSVAVFSKAGYRQADRTEIAGHQAHDMVFCR